MKPNKPIIITTDAAQPAVKGTTHFKFLKINQRVVIINKKTQIQKQ